MATDIARDQDEAEAVRVYVIADIVELIKQFQYGDSIETIARILFLRLVERYGFEPRDQGRRYHGD